MLIKWLRIKELVEKYLVEIVNKIIEFRSEG